MKDKTIGKMSAILDMTEKNINEIQDTGSQINEATTRLQQGVKELDGLRDIVGDIETIINDGKRPDWLSTSQLAKELSVTPKTIHNWFKQGVIPGHRISEKSHIRFDRNEVARAIKSEKGK